MFRLMKNLILFQLGQRAARKTARKFGLGWMSRPIGLLGGLKMIK